MQLVPILGIEILYHYMMSLGLNEFVSSKSHLKGRFSDFFENKMLFLSPKKINHNHPPNLFCKFENVHAHNLEVEFPTSKSII